MDPENMDQSFQLVYFQVVYFVRSEVEVLVQRPKDRPGAAFA